MVVVLKASRRIINKINKLHVNGRPYKEFPAKKKHALLIKCIHTSAPFRVICYNSNLPLFLYCIKSFILLDFY